MYTNEGLNEKASAESWIDIDWYFMDKFGKVAIVASAGGLLPDPIANDMNKLKSMTTYFLSLPVISNDVYIEKYALDKIAKYTRQQKDAYLEDVYFMVSRGFYYFDKVELNNYVDFKYQLKATPSTPLIINKDDSGIQEMLPDIIIDNDLEHIKLFSVDEIA
jgi:hypothetical protein